MPRLMVSFHGTAAPDWVLDGVHRGDVAAVCLFAYNVASPAQVRELADSLRQAAREGGRPAPLVGIDQEGGQLMAVIDGATPLPGNMALGAAGRTDLAEEAGRILGLELLAMGCNLDFAPVLDLVQHPDNPVIGVRSFGDDPHRVAELGAATVRGMQSTGVLATAKHFPGHGDTDGDSHHAAPSIGRSRAELEAVELVPFRAAVAGRVAAVMSAHVRYPALDTEPATLSRPILTGLLRERLGFEGLILTDAMDMAAVAHLDPHRRTAAALAAGADLVLLGHLEDQAQLIARLRSTFDAASLERIERARRSLPSELPELGRVGCAEHRAMAQEIADAAVTVLRRGPLPLAQEPAEALAVITVSAGELTPADSTAGRDPLLGQQIAARRPGTRCLTLPYGANRPDLDRALSACAHADLVVVGTVNAPHDASQGSLLRELHERGQRVVLVSLRMPFDLQAAPFADAYLCAYGMREPNTEAVARVLFGEIEARGQLPCAVDPVRRRAAS